MEKTETNQGDQVLNLLSQKQPIQPELTDHGIARTMRSCCLIPQRFVLSIIGLIGVCNAFTMRVCLNMAITQMVNKTKDFYIETDFDNGSFVEAACPNEIVRENVTVLENPYATFKWDEATQGFILSAFYYGYATTQVLGGYLAERYGGKWTLGLGLLSTALFTFLTPWVTRAGGATWLFILRILQGMGESYISEWRVAFWVCFVVLLGTNVVYCIWADGQQQWWDDVRQFGYPPGWKHGPLVRETNPEQPGNNEDIDVY